MEQGGAGARQADDEDRAFDFHFSNAGEIHPVEGDLQPAGQHPQDLSLDRGEAVDPVWPRPIGPVYHFAEPVLQPVIGKAIGPGRALGESQNCIGAQQACVAHLPFDFANRAAIRSAKSGRPAQRK